MTQYKPQHSTGHRIGITSELPPPPPFAWPRGANVTYFNEKYGEREIKLAVNGWRWVANYKTEEGIQSRIKSEQEKGLETRVEDIAYMRIAFFAKILDGTKAVYIKGPDIKSRVPEDVIAEARKYSRKDKDAQLKFLLSVYQEILKQESGGKYSKKYLQREENIAIILNYFADKLRDFGKITEAQKLENAITMVFPTKTKKDLLNEK